MRGLSLAAWLLFVHAFGCLPATLASANGNLLSDLDAACTERGLPTCVEAAKRHGDAPRRVDLLYAGCTHDQSDACRALGELFRHEPALIAAHRARFARGLRQFCGSPYPDNIAECMAALFFARACDLGDAPSCADHAAQLASGVLRRQNLPKARALRERACKAGHTPSCEQLALTSEGDPIAAARLLQAACDAGSAAACAELAHRYAVGHGVTLSQQRARALFEASCKAGSGAGCAGLSRMLDRGLGGPSNSYQALNKLDVACKASHATACVTLGRRVESGRDAAADPAGAYDHYRRAATLFGDACDGSAAGRHEACASLGALLREGSGVPQDRQRGLALQERACNAGNASGCIMWLSRDGRLSGEGALAASQAMQLACAKGDGEACFVLGRIGAPSDTAPSDAYARGCRLGDAPSCNALGVSRFPPGDPRPFERACSMGDAAGCHHLAMSIELPGKDQDTERAVELYRNACRWRLPEACTRLAELKATGATSGADPLQGHVLYERACELGDVKACAELGAMLIAGTRVPRDTERGQALLERACRNGAMAACSNLGATLYLGRAVERDPSRGERLLARACRAGLPRACLSRIELSKADEPSAVAWLNEAVPRAAQACRRAIAVCDGAGPTPALTWREVVEPFAKPSRVVIAAGNCDVALERTCNDATEAAISLCERDEATCADTVSLLKAAEGAGLSVSSTQRKKIEARLGKKKR